MATATGLATGTFSPTSVLIGAAAGAATGGIGASSLGVGGAMLANGAVGATTEIANGIASGQGVNWRNVLASGAGSAVTGGMTQYSNAANTTLARTIAIGATNDATGSAVQQTIAGQNPISWNTALSATGGGTTAGFTHALRTPTPTYDITPPATNTGPDFVAGPIGSQSPVPVSQSRMAAGFDDAGFPRAPTGSPGMEYTTPDGSLVRLMEPAGQAPRRASFTNANGGPINPFTGKPVQPPAPPGVAMKDWVRLNTHVEQTP
jgi:hypothetical protein